MKNSALLALLLIGSTAFAAADMNGNYNGVDATSGKPCVLRVWATAGNDDLLPYDASISYSEAIFDLRDPKYVHGASPDTYSGETIGAKGAEILRVVVDAKGKPIRAALISGDPIPFGYVCQITNQN